MLDGAAMAELDAGRESATVRVSVLMLTFNRPQFVARAIRSVLSQNRRDWELIVVDDSSGAEVESIVAAWTPRDERIRYFHRTAPGNIANATNFGLRKARGEFIAILDDDDFWIADDKLTNQIRFFEQNPDCVACGGGALVTDARGHETLRYSKPEGDVALRKWALIANPILHSTSMYRRAHILQCGLYDESLPGFQDWDVFLKLGHVGTLRNLTQPFVSYTLWEGGGSFQENRGNTGAAIRIVCRHRRHYRNFLPAICVAGLSYAYARLPKPLKRASFSFLSRLKKSAFSNRVAAA